MTLWKTITVADNERAFVFRRNRLETVLDAGQHRVSLMNGKITYELYKISDVVFNQNKNSTGSTAYC
ncbi:hypothetical protein A9Q99_06080 [Gammaproteobacteria bacterium 45_16_T64]|nr:hypothetical protein A9Q99_06080 [Gammaproteobacteria bacterium 45_16_T64]